MEFKIEGNKLKLEEVKEVIGSSKVSHERNVLEVRNYFEKVVSNHANRVMKGAVDMSNNGLQLITVEDLIM